MEEAVREFPADTLVANAPEDGGTPAVSLIDATKLYGSLAAVDHVDLDIRARELFTLLGPSGSGKTTILRIMAGLIELSSGELLMSGEDVRSVPTFRRNIGLVFQSLALFPHMSVFDNIAFPLRMRRSGREEISRRVKEALDMVRLPDIGDRRVHELSGGQQQRVAFARSLVYDPKLLLLDEPLGALDRRLREEMQLEIVRLHRDIDVTIVNVTHDQREALMLSDRIGVMRNGRLEQVGRSEEIYNSPTRRFVAEFLGNANLIDGEIVPDGAGLGLRTSAGVTFTLPNLPAGVSGRATVSLRAEELELLGPGDAAPSGASVAGRVMLRVFEGEAVYYEVDVPSLVMVFKVSASKRRADPAIGDDVHVTWDPADVTVIPDDGGSPGG
jgi:putative spermidine/putrescine transport system ATP-binding protein